jgi:hypothetical protein
MRRVFHILVCLLALLPAGCVEPMHQSTGQTIVLKLFCTDPLQTKTEPGVDAYNENLIKGVDLFFYSGDIITPGTVNVPAVLYKHIDVDYTTTGSANFLVNVSSEQVHNLFPTHIDKMTVFAVANYLGTEPLVSSETDLSGTKLENLYAKTVETTFANPLKTKQDCFMMRGLEVLDLNGVDGREKEIVSSGDVHLDRYASKLTVAVHLSQDVLLGSYEHWHPMRENMQVYLVDGVKTVKLSGKDNALTEDSYFDYDKDRRRFATRNSQTGEITDIIPPTVVDPGTPQEKVYYNTYPMYMYPQSWEYGSSDKVAGTCEPYLKLILPWSCDEDIPNGVYANQRQCYYKVMLPKNFNHEFLMNNWYHLDLDIEILGALSDESALPINACTCFIVPWQNENDVVQHTVDVGDAHYLFIERDSIVLRNTGDLTVPYLTSHPVRIQAGSIRATRPYYGIEKNGTLVYDNRAKVCSTMTTGGLYPLGTRYLDYIDVEGKELTTKDTTITVNGTSYDAVKYAINGFEFSIVEALATVFVHHDLNNDYTKKDFDYSPYSIFFTLEHSGAGDNMAKSARIEQYPAVYIDRKTNSDAKDALNPHGTTTVWPKSNQTKASDSQYWGYVFVDGGAYWPENAADAFQRGINGSTKCRWEVGARQNRRDQNGNKQDMFYKLEGSDDLSVASRQEYQWRTVWYTGGSLDMYRINVTALPANSTFLIGDPRTYQPRDLNAEYRQSFNSKFYDSNGDFKQGVLPEPDPDLRDGFAIAPALYPENGDNRPLMWYYPADVTDRTMNMLAPSYRISSKFSGVEFSGILNTTDITKEYAQYRCAAYQEDGFPAGRWRLPTFGEIKFIAMLSSNGIFAELFTSGRTYWSSNGAVYVQNGGTVKLRLDLNVALLRCVYDTWYWGDEQQTNRNQFVWGDQPR